MEQQGQIINVRATYPRLAEALDAVIAEYGIDDEVIRQEDITLPTFRSDRLLQNYK